MNDVIIREARVEDVPAVVALLRSVLGEYDLSFGEGSDTDAQVLGLPGSYREAGGFFWVATRSDGALLGTCGVYPIDSATWELRKMYLYASARGLGLGRRLLDLAVDFARAAGGHRLVLDTIHDMTQAIAFYEAHGFQRDDLQIRGSRCERGYARDLHVAPPAERNPI